MTRHTISEDPGSSLFTVFRTFEQVTRKHFQTLVPIELLCLPRQRRPGFLREFAGQADVILTTDGWFGPLREQWAADFRLMFLALGGLPRGASGLRRLLPHLRGDDLVVFTSRADEAIFKNLVRATAARTAQLPLPVDTEHFRPLPADERRRLRQLFGFTEDDVVMLYVGRITAEKNIQSLLRTAASVMTARPQVHLLIVGPVKDVRFEEFGSGPCDLQRHFRTLLERWPALRSRIRFLGAVRHQALPPLYGLADLFVNLTVHHDENFGYTQVEAMSSGLPVVCTDWGGLKETVVAGRTGYRVPTHVSSRGIQLDRWAAVQHCERLVSDRALRLRMGTAARARVQAEYSFERFERRYLELLRGGGRSRRALNRLSPLGRELDRTFPPGAPIRYQLPLGEEGRRAYRLYRRLIAPYATGGEPPGCAATDLVFIQPDRLRRRGDQVMIGDPLWPARIPLPALQHRVLAALESAPEGGLAAAVPMRWLLKRVGRRLSMGTLLRAVRGLQRWGLVGVSPRR